MESESKPAVAWSERVIRLRRGRARPRVALAVLAAVALPAAATGLGLSVLRSSAFGALSAYILAVAVAALVAGTASGVGAALLSFLGLNYFFTEPRHTFEVKRPGDAVALVAFLLVASVVGALLARAVGERHRAERRAEEMGALNRLALRLLSEEPVERLFQDAAGMVSRLLRLDRAAIVADVGGETITVAEPKGADPRSDDGLGDEGSEEFPLGTEGRSLGTLTAVRRSPSLSNEERRLLAAFAGQVALGAARARFDHEIRQARLDVETNSLRAALFSSVTHDLRTPLSTIKAGVSSLLEPGTELSSSQSQDLLKAVLEETDRLNRLVGNLLDLARLRAGALVPSLTPMGVEEVVESVIGRLELVLAPFRVRTIVRPELPAVLLDPVQVDQALSNVLENAARHAPPGSDIQVTVVRFASWVEVRVSDRGPGIPPEEREHVLEPFYRRDTDRARGGSGLGLAIANAVMLAHGGGLVVEGAPGGGTAVIMRFPVRGSRPPRERDGRPLPAPVERRR